MSFGFGIGDFLAVGKLVWNVYRAYADAPEQFRDISQEILSLHIVIQKVEDQLGISGSDGAASGSGSQASRSQPQYVTTLSTKDKDDLRVLYDGLQGIMKELDDLLKKYQNLESSHNPIDRLKWGQEDLVRLREKIRSNITLLTAFNGTLANCHLVHQSAQLGQQNLQLEYLIQQNLQLIRLQEQLGQALGVSHGGLRHRGSVASLHSIASFALSIGQREEWKVLSRELYQNGITADMIKAKKDEICRLFRTASVVGSTGNCDPGKSGGRQENPADRPGVQFDNMMYIPPSPMMYATYVVGGVVWGLYPLHMAAVKGRTNRITVLLDWGVNIDARGIRQWTALHKAACYGQIEVVKLLLDRGATIDATTNVKWTALHLAAQGGYIEIVELLLDRGATIGATAIKEWTALHVAAFNGHTEIVKLLLDRDATIDATTTEKCTALHFAAQNGHIEIVRLLLDRGATIDATANEECTALYLAAQNGHTEIVRLLLGRGATIDATTNEKYTALDVAVQNGHIEIVKLLEVHIAKFAAPVP